MSWVPLAIAGWLMLSVVVALAVGGGIRLADRRARRSRAVPDPVAGGDAVVPLSAGRRPVIRGCVPPAERLQAPRPGTAAAPLLPRTGGEHPR